MEKIKPRLQEIKDEFVLMLEGKKECSYINSLVLRIINPANKYYKNQKHTRLMFGAKSKEIRFMSFIHCFGHIDC